MTTPLSLAAKFYFRIREYKLLRRYMRRLRKGEDLRLTNEHSKTAYEAYDHSEQQQYLSSSVRTLDHGRIRRVPFKKIREVYLAEIYQQIEALIADNPERPITVLEVGCGNCINAKCLLEKYGDRIAYTGFDLSPKRIEVSKQFWGEKLNGANLLQMSATNIEFPDKEFDLVFSMHVLEQISYLVDKAMDEMLRVAAYRVVFVEPTYEFGNPAQRLKLVLNDQLRTLLPEIRKRELNVLKSYPAETLANPTNPTGIHVIRV